MKCSVLIVAEGEHELAGVRPDPARTTLVRRLLGDGIDMQATVKRIREFSRHTHPGKGDRLGRKFINIMEIAEREGFDAWFLADHFALSSVLATTVDKQPNPETISDPKKVCGSLSNAAGGDGRLRDLYSALAAIVDLGILRARCPTGFAAFADRVEGLKSVLSRCF